VIDQGVAPVAPLPYAVQALVQGLEICYSNHVQIIDATDVIDGFAPHMSIMDVGGSFTGRQVVAFDDLSVTVKFDGIVAGSSMIAYLARGSPFITVELQAMAPHLVTVGAILEVSELTTNKNCEAVLSRAMPNVPQQTLVITLNSGQLWLIHASKPFSYTTDQSSVTFSTPITGSLRVALVPSTAALQTLLIHVNTYPVGGNASFSLPAGGAEGLGNVGSAAVLRFAWATEVMEALPSLPSPACEGDGKLLMLALPHHVASIQPGSDVLWKDEVVYQCMKGSMRGMVGTELRMEETLDAVQWDVDVAAVAAAGDAGDAATGAGLGATDGNSTTASPNAQARPTSAAHILNAKAPALMKLIHAALVRDTAVTPTAIDVYSFGKQVARQAMLVLIADFSGAPQATLDTALASTQDALVPWLSTATAPPSPIPTSIPTPTPPADPTLPALATSEDVATRTAGVPSVTPAPTPLPSPSKFLYDATWGGVCTRTGLTDSMADFGNGWYNDHHFHYGYILFAAAVVGKFNGEFLLPQARGGYREQLMALVHDIASVNKTTLFPRARMKDWYDGHSWASGLFVIEDGKAQESSSEAVNAYYAVSLLGEAMVAAASAEAQTKEEEMTRTTAAVNAAVEGAQIRDHGRVLLALELRAAKTYWHMDPAPLKEERPQGEEGQDGKEGQTDEEKQGGWEEVAVMGGKMEGTAADGRVKATEKGGVQDGEHIYPAEFAANAMVGIVSSTKASYSTWFGRLPEYVHGVNMLPFTPVSTKLLTPSFVRMEYAVLEAQVQARGAAAPMADQWRNLMVLDHAIINPRAAWREIQALEQYDIGTSLSHAMYWIAAMFVKNASATGGGGSGESGGEIGEYLSKIERELEAAGDPDSVFNPASWQCRGAPACSSAANGAPLGCCLSGSGCCSGPPPLMDCCPTAPTPTQPPTPPSRACHGQPACNTAGIGSAPLSCCAGGVGCCPGLGCCI
jgi:endo-1,3(4)-beta-glucanase